MQTAEELYTEEQNVPERSQVGNTCERFVASVYEAYRVMGNAFFWRLDGSTGPKGYQLMIKRVGIISRALESYQKKAVVFQARKENSVRSHDPDKRDSGPAPSGSLAHEGHCTRLVSACLHRGSHTMFHYIPSMVSLDVDSNFF